MTYARSFKPWGLVICAGAYIDDGKKQVAKTGDLIQEGLDKLQQANAISQYSQQTRQNTAYFFAFGLCAGKVVRILPS